jgi:hypothetical protein
MIFISGPHELTGYWLQISHEFQGWCNKLSLLKFTEDQQGRVKKELRSFEQATKKLFDVQMFIGEPENPYSWYEDLENLQNRIRDVKEEWLESVLQIERIRKLLPPGQENGMSRYIFQRGYELMFQFMIDFKDMTVISEKDLSSFFNERTHGKIITAYATNIYKDFEDGKQSSLGNFGIKKRLQMRSSIYGLPDLLKCE